MSTLRTVRILRTLALSIVAAAAIAQADTITTPDGTITVTDVVTPDDPTAGLFQYDYTVTDGTGLLAVLDIAITPGITITDFAAPGGVNTPSSAFTAVTDTVNTPGGPEEFVSFIENNGIFTGTPESGFIFDSTVAPSPTTFGVTLFDGTTGTGNVTGPVVAATPEPGSLALCALGGAALMFWRKRSVASHPQTAGRLQ
jgi:hypothetical protein